MARKQKEIWAWVLGIVVFLIILALLFQGNQSNVDKETETITISGINQIETINNPDKIVSILISGSNSIIYITKETEISQITISGINHIINLCKEHSPSVIKNGINNIINYNNC